MGRVALSHAWRSHLVNLSRCSSWQGDFGGPLVNDMQELVGLASWGVGCGHPSYPGAFVNLAQDDVNAWVLRTAGISASLE